MSDKHEEAVELIESLTEAVDGLYTIGNVLGFGRCGITVQARDVSGRLVALKIAWKDQDARNQLLRETELTAKVEHPNVLKPRMLDLPEPLLVAETPLMKETLGAWLDGKQPQSYEKVRGVLDAIGAALDTAHTAGIVHGGILPEKIFLDGQGHCFIGDFSLRLPQSVFVEGNRPSTIGFAPYAPVEQRHDLPTCSGRIDQFALAVVAYELLRGHRVWRFNEEGVLEIDAIDMVVSRPIAATAPMSASAAVRRATSREAGYRYSSMNEFVRAFAGMGKAATPSEQLVKQGFVIRKRVSLLWIAPVAAGIISAIVWMQPGARETAYRFWDSDWTSSEFWHGDWIMGGKFGTDINDAPGNTVRGGSSREPGNTRVGPGNTRAGASGGGGRNIDPYPRVAGQSDTRVGGETQPGQPGGSQRSTPSTASVVSTPDAGSRNPAQQGEASSNATTGALEVTINGNGSADVYIDGEKSGHTPFTWTGSTGRHVVTLSPSSGFSPEFIVVTISTKNTAHAVFSAR